MRAPEWHGGAEVLRRLEQDGILERDGERHRTTRRWQGAMARAAAQLSQGGAASSESFDLRVPIAFALVELYGSEHPDDELSAFVETLGRIEASALEP